MKSLKIQVVAIEETKEGQEAEIIYISKKIADINLWVSGSGI